MQNRKTLYLILVSVMLLAFALSACGGDDKKGGTKTFYDGGVSIDLPGGWSSEDSDLSGGYGQIMIFSSKKIRDAESAEDVPNNAAVGVILVGTVHEFELADGPEGSLRSYLELEGGLPENAEFETLEINGNPATRYTGTEDLNGVEAYTYNVGIFFDEKIRVYLLLYGIKGDQDKFDATFQGLTDSLAVDVEKLLPQLEGE